MYIIGMHGVTSSVGDPCWRRCGGVNHSMETGCTKAEMPLGELAHQVLILKDSEKVKTILTGRVISWVLSLNCILLLSCIGILVLHDVTIRDLDRQLSELKTVCMRDRVPMLDNASGTVELLSIVRPNRERRSRSVRAVDPVDLLRERSSELHNSKEGSNLWWNLQTLLLVDRTRTEISELKAFTENAVSELRRKGGSSGSTYAPIRSAASNDVVDASSHQQGYFWFDFDALANRQARNGSRTYSDPQHRYVQGIPLQVNVAIGHCEPPKSGLCLGAYAGGSNLLGTNFPWPVKQRIQLSITNNDGTVIGEKSFLNFEQGAFLGNFQDPPNLESWLWGYDSLVETAGLRGSNALRDGRIRVRVKLENIS